MIESHLLNLPNEILEKILSYLSYDEIAKNRLVCRQFDVRCRVLLNVGFLNMERRHSSILKKVKSQLPRRESERRAHPLARHSDILTAIETRISMLRMTFMKFIEKNVCCFIPGKVIDEILRILIIVNKLESPPRTQEVLQELRDISSMAIEHFDEKIAPNLKLPLTIPICSAVPGSSVLNLPLQNLFGNHSFRKDLNILQQQNLAQRKQIFLLKDIVGKLFNKVKKQSNIMHLQHSKIRDQSAKLTEQESSIAELKRHVEEWDAKFQDLVTNLNRARDETTLCSSNAVSNSPTSGTFSSLTSPIATVCSTTPIMYRPNIKPRMAKILPKSMSVNIPAPIQDYQRKRRTSLCESVSHIPSKMSRLQYVSTNDDYETNSNDEKNNSVYHRYSDISLLKVPSFISSGLENWLKAPITSIKSRKRKLQ